MTKGRAAILVALLALGFVIGRLAVRLVLNTMIGGTLFGGNLL